MELKTIFGGLGSEYRVKWNRIFLDDDTVGIFK